jgi:hypothetical protein
MATRRFNLSGIQVAASVLATLTGAFAASYLGVASTLFGAAVGSIASTVGTEVYRHYLGRTHERLRGAVVSRQYRTAGQAVAGQAVAGRADPASVQNRVGVTSRRQAGGPDAAETEILPVRRPDDTVPGAVTGLPKPISLNDPIHDSPTEIFAVTGGRSRAVPAGTPAARDGGGKKTRPRWLVMTGIAVGTFLVAVAAITVFELSVGKPLNAVVWQRHGGGTTVGGVVGGRSTQTTPARTPTATATPSAPSTSPSASVGVTPTPSATSPSGSPSSTAGPSPGGPANTQPVATPTR